MSRRFTSTRSISLSDTDPAGRLRLDAVARYLQDAATDDWLDAGFDLDAHVWVVRRTEVAVHEAFRPEDALEVETWCSGVGGSSAARRYSVRGRSRGRIEAESVWTHLGRDLRPKRLDERFHEVYGTSAGARRAPTRFTLPPPPRDDGERWVFRRTDVDRLGHVNNAAYWVPLEERWPSSLGGAVRVVLEYRRPIDLGDEVTLVEAGTSLWLVVDGDVRSAARLDPEGAGETEQLA
ncbi:MAG TPA: acyl-ACP thioesterase domain-containing protein [Gaiellaceae bacterium]